MTKISNSSSPESFFSSSKFTKTRFRTPLGEQLPCSPRPLSRMGRGISIPLPVEGYGVSGFISINYYLARERKFQGTKVPGSESSWNFRSRERESSIPWYFRSREQKLLGAKVPVTIVIVPFTTHKLLLTMATHTCDKTMKQNGNKTVLFQPFAHVK